MSANPDYEARVLSMIVLPHGEPIFTKGATTVRIDDEDAGEFVVLEQTSTELGPQQIRIGHEDWPVLRETIDKMIKAYRS